MIRVAVLDDYHAAAADLADWHALPAGMQVTFFHDHLSDTEALTTRLRDFDVLCLMRERTPLPAVLIGALPKLKLVTTSGLHNAAIDVAHCQRKRITVCGTSGTAHATAELSWALVMALCRGIVSEAAALRAGKWQVTLGRELYGARLGLVGLGRIGSLMARYGQAFGMDVVAWSANLTEEAARAAGAKAVSKDELFATSDVVSLHYRLSPRSAGLVGRSEIARMKPTAYLVNTSRAGLIDHAALSEALHSGKLAGAALDVFTQEPLPHDDPLRQVPRLLLTPHLGYTSHSAFAGFYREMIENIRAWHDGSPIRTILP